MLHWLVILCSLIVTLWRDIISDVIQHMCQAYNRPGAMSWGIPGSTLDG